MTLHRIRQLAFYAVQGLFGVEVLLMVAFLIWAPFSKGMMIAALVFTSINLAVLGWMFVDTMKMRRENAVRELKERQRERGRL